MLLVRRICMEQHRPVFEVMSWPSSELEYWSIFFSIQDNKDKPIITTKTADEISVYESKAKFKSIFG